MKTLTFAVARKSLIRIPKSKKGVTNIKKASDDTVILTFTNKEDCIKVKKLLENEPYFKATPISYNGMSLFLQLNTTYSYIINDEDVTICQDTDKEWYLIEEFDWDQFDKNKINLL